MLLLILLTLRLLLTVGGVGVPVLTIQSPDEDLIDCIKQQEQPAFDNPLLKDHVIQLIPTDVDYTPGNEDEYGWQVWHQAGKRCPEGSVPIRRVTSHQNEIPSLTSEERATHGHEYAVGFVEANVTASVSIYGTQVTMNVWRPKVEGPDEFSLGQTWVSAGSYNSSDLNTIEAGWQVYPRIYNDYQPRFFCYWTMDAYVKTRCYNTRCPGFVQVSRTAMVEGAINQTSILGGTQFDLTIRVWKDRKLECWWIGVIIESGVLVPVGYYPTAIFTLLAGHADMVKWGGEITNQNPSGRHTKTQMGSGFLPEAGFRNAAYMRNLEILTDVNGLQPVQDLHIGATHATYYHANYTEPDGPDFGSHFYYGGSEVLPLHARAFHPSLDSFLLFVCFSLFWFV